MVDRQLQRTRVSADFAQKKIPPSPCGTSMASGDLIVARCTNELGRALYAACTISAGDLILSDHPALLLEGNPSIPARIEALLSPSCQILRRHLFTPDPAD